jgi:hypothetical protein
MVLPGHTTHHRSDRRLDAAILVNLTPRLPVLLKLGALFSL